jgi:hypothetical protein
VFPGGIFSFFSLSQLIGSFCSDRVHETHSCDTRLCPSTCELCMRLCGEPHLHGLARGVHHLCGLVVFPCLRALSKLTLLMNREAHPCSALCSDNGICNIETAPQSIEATFTGRHETFQYTKVIQSSSIMRSISLIFLVCMQYTQGLWTVRTLASC